MTLVTVTTNSHLIAGFEKDDDNYAPYQVAQKNHIDQRAHKC